MWFEERVSSARQQVFEAEAGGGAAADDPRRRQIDYFELYVKTSGEVPHSFRTDLDPAELSSVGLDEHQTIVRLEMLWRPLAAWGEPFEALLDAFNRPKSDPE